MGGCSEPNPIYVRQPDSLKSTLDRIEKKIVAGLSGSDEDFYKREFGFFAEVTGISGKLKPLVEASASKAEKKVRGIPVSPESDRAN